LAWSPRVLTWNRWVLAAALVAAGTAPSLRQISSRRLRSTFKSLKDFDYFTFVHVGGGDALPLKPPRQDYSLDYDKGVITLHFTLPLEKPLDARSQVVTVDVYDPSFFVAFRFATEAPVKLLGAEVKVCVADVEKPDPGSEEDAKTLSEAFFSQLGSNSNFGARQAPCGALYRRGPGALPRVGRRLRQDQAADVDLPQRPGRNRTTMIRPECIRSEAMTATSILSVVFAAALAAFAATGAVFAQDDTDKGSGSMMDQKSGGESIMDQKSGGGSMMDQKSGGGSMMGHGMMMGHRGMMGGMRGKHGGYLCGRMTAHVDGRLAFLKTELKITPEQESQWNDYAAAVKDNAKTIGERCTAMMAQSNEKTPSLPERLDAQEQFMMTRLDALRAVGKALKPLYAVLSDEQKQLADQFIRSSSGMM
jgi:hypothetical protein